jgi:hypothetical protein
VLIGGVIFVLAATAFLLWPSRPDIALNVSQVEAFQALQPQGKDLDLWLVTIEATNLTSKALFFASEKPMVKVKPTDPWTKPDRAGLLDCLLPGEKRGFALTVPPGSYACRLVIECRLGALGGKVERFFRSSPVLPKASAWAADHLPRKRIAVEVPLPKAPTWASPKIGETHNHRPGVDAGGAFCLQIERHWPGTTQAGC